MLRATSPGITQQGASKGHLSRLPSPPPEVIQMYITDKKEAAHVETASV